METKNLIIICATVILAVIIVLSTFIFVNMGNETSIQSDISNSIQNGENISFHLLDKNNNLLANKTISLSFKDENGKVNSYNLTTDNNGKAKYKVNLTEGNYTFSADFAGDLFLQSSSLDKKVEVKELISESDSSSSSQTKTYGDWQKDYETGEYDEDGNPIYRSVMSTSGGQYEPGIYESYWSANGPISERRIG